MPLLDCKRLEKQLAHAGADAVHAELSDLAVSAAAYANVLIMAPGNLRIGRTAQAQLLRKLVALERRLGALAPDELVA